MNFSKCFFTFFAIVFSLNIVAKAGAQSIDPVFFPPDSPQRKMCEMLQRPGFYLFNPVLDCDDASWLMCLQFPESDCWQFGANGPGRERPGHPTHDFSHAMIIVRDPSNPNRFCAFEPYGCQQVHCWTAPSGDPSDGYPADDIRRALCQMREWHDVLDCDRGPTTIEPPRPGHILDPDWGGEPGWWQCGSLHYKQKLCYQFRGEDGQVQVRCVPTEIGTNLDSCDTVLDPDTGGTCIWGQSKLCRWDDNGGLLAVGCCTSGGILGGGLIGHWCISPQPRDYPICDGVVGGACNPRDGGFRDCVDSYPVQPVTPSIMPGDITPVTVLQCLKCRGDDEMGPPAPGEPTYCWKRLGGKLANSNIKSSKEGIRSINTGKKTIVRD